MEEHLPQVHVGLLNGVDEALVKTFVLFSDQVRPEQNFWSPEPRRPNFKSAAIRQHERLLLGLHRLLLLRVGRQVASFLFDGPDDLELSRRPEVDSLFPQQKSEVTRDVTACDVGSHHAVRQREAFVDRHSVGDAVSGVEHDAGGSAGGVQAQNSLKKEKLN